jgi:anaerobic C4-dicarboxylate transporter
MARPNLNDPAERLAYRRELAGVAKGVRYSGVGLAALGALLAVIRALYWRDMPKLIPQTVIVIAFALMAVAIMVRTRYHARRMRE